MISALYRAEIIRYLKSPDTLVFSLIFPLVVLIINRLNIENVLTGSLLLLHLPSLVDTIFLSRSFLSRGFLIQLKTIEREVNLATLFFLITISFFRVFIISVLSLILPSRFDMIAITTLTLVTVASIYNLLFTSVSCYLGSGWLTISSGIILTLIIIFEKSISDIYPNLVKSYFGYILFFPLITFSWLSLYFVIKKRLDTIGE